MDAQEKQKIREELGGLTEKEFNEILHTAVQDINNEFDKLCKAFAEKNFNILKNAAHAIKGVSGNFRMKKIYEISFIIEHAAADKRSNDEIDNHIRCLAEEVVKINNGK